MKKDRTHDHIKFNIFLALRKRGASYKDYINTLKAMGINPKPSNKRAIELDSVDLRRRVEYIDPVPDVLKHLDKGDIINIALNIYNNMK